MISKSRTASILRLKVSHKLKKKSLTANSYKIQTLEIKYVNACVILGVSKGCYDAL